MLTLPPFLELPEDILLSICSSYLPVKDLLSLKQTCRAFHVFGESDYLWHRIVSRWDGVPLNLTCGHEPVSLSAQYLQQAIMWALELDSNWHQVESEIKRRDMIYLGSQTLSMQLLKNARLLQTHFNPHGPRPHQRFAVLPGRLKSWTQTCPDRALRCDELHHVNIARREGGHHSCTGQLPR